MGPWPSCVTEGLEVPRWEQVVASPPPPFPGPGEEWAIQGEPLSPQHRAGGGKVTLSRIIGAWEEWGKPSYMEGHSQGR